MTATVLNLHTHWRLTFEAQRSTVPGHVDEVWVDAWLASRPVSLYAAVAAAVRQQPTLRHSALTAAVRVRM